MKKSSWLGRWIVKFSLILLVALSIGIAIHFISSQRVLAQSDTAVRSEIQDLKRRINNLEIESSRRASVRTIRPSAPSQPGQITPPQVIDGRIVGRSDPLFERLANLTIELRERVAELEKRVEQLEQKF
jgi:BMFP domain-containing protein YqiC